jgi:hypothetical protein
MSVEKLALDLKQVRAQFEEWRARKTKPQQRIPAHLWAVAVKLLECYPVNQICRELHLSAEDLYRHRDQISARALPSPQQRRDKDISSSNGQFLELSGQPLLSASTSNVINHDDSLPASRPDPSATCQFVLEHKDGCRLTISLPLAWSRLESLCLNLLRAER